MSFAEINFALQINLKTHRGTTMYCYNLQQIPSYLLKLLSKSSRLSACGCGIIWKEIVDNMHLNISNSLTHMLDTENSDELNVIGCSPYITDALLLQSRENRKHGLSIVSLNCQSLPAKIDYIRLLIDKFMKNDCPEIS